MFNWKRHLRVLVSYSVHTLTIISKFHQKVILCCTRPTH
ncbi:hypothetical protein [Escherichia phage ZCEC13]|uniref:Uncharacterized protein n=1 Tax=Escherichia phage ZCEC13 TaxID=2935866 RepID=A0AAE9HH40_9CAUD|nr:hypothetical protein [Escherichia phage ZCEC13]